MAVSQTPIVVGIFQEEAPAKKAVDTLRELGFTQDQIGVAMKGGAPVDHLAQDFMQLGVAADPARYYEDEFKAGHIVVSVRHDGRMQDATQTLRSNGGYDYRQDQQMASGMGAPPVSNDWQRSMHPSEPAQQGQAQPPMTDERTQMRPPMKEQAQMRSTMGEQPSAQQEQQAAIQQAREQRQGGETPMWMQRQQQVEAERERPPWEDADTAIDREQLEEEHKHDSQLTTGERHEPRHAKGSKEEEKFPPYMESPQRGTEKPESFG